MACGETCVRDGLWRLSFDAYLWQKHLRRPEGRRCTLDFLAWKGSKRSGKSAPTPSFLAENRMPL